MPAGLQTGTWTPGSRARRPLRRELAPGCSTARCLTPAAACSMHHVRACESCDSAGMWACWLAARTRLCSLYRAPHEEPSQERSTAHMFRCLCRAGGRDNSLLQQLISRRCKGRHAGHSTQGVCGDHGLASSGGHVGCHDCAGHNKERERLGFQERKGNRLPCCFHSPTPHCVRRQPSHRRHIARSARPAC